jgi:hypothetical protein
VGAAPADPSQGRPGIPAGPAFTVSVTEGLRSPAGPVARSRLGHLQRRLFGIAEHWDGSRWTIRRLPVPPVPPGEEPVVLPASVSCMSVTACVAVGSSHGATLAERWNGATWTIQPAPNPA